MGFKSLRVGTVESSGCDMGAVLLTGKFSLRQWSDLTKNAIYKLDQARMRITNRRQTILGRIFKTLVFLILAGICAVIGYAYLGDLKPDRMEVNQPITLDVN